MHDRVGLNESDVWLGHLGNALEGGDIPAVLALFHDDCYWRDFLAFTWNVKTVEGKASLEDMLGHTLSSTRPRGWKVTRIEELDVAESRIWFRFATAAGEGLGIATLQDGLCRSILTTLQSLVGHEEPSGRRRPLGVRHGVVRLVDHAALRAAERDAGDLGAGGLAVLGGLGDHVAGLVGRLVGRADRVEVGEVVLDVEDARGRPALVEDPQQQVLRADHVVAQPNGLVAALDERGTRAV